jgi:hypothetical protein
VALPLSEVGPVGERYRPEPEFYVRFGRSF